jgi:hypothetical protein
VTVTDLVAVHKINNLTVLDLSDGQISIDHQFSNFDERVMRSWAELARSGEAFQHLRVMMFGWQENLADWIFRYTAYFPSLCQLIVTDCPHMHQKNRNDWEKVSEPAGWEARHAKRSAKDLRPILSSPDFHFGSVSGCYYESMELFAGLTHPKRQSLLQRLPVLEMSLGTPRRWSHIVEDFPSTRTIIFDKVGSPPGTILANADASIPREACKRERRHEFAAQRTASPPLKRGPKARPIKTSMEDLLKDLQG